MQQGERYLHFERVTQAEVHIGRIVGDSGLAGGHGAARHRPANDFAVANLDQNAGSGFDSRDAGSDGLAYERNLESLSHFFARGWMSACEFHADVERLLVNAGPQ